MKWILLMVSLISAGELLPAEIGSFHSPVPVMVQVDGCLITKVIYVTEDGKFNPNGGWDYKQSSINCSSTECSVDGSLAGGQSSDHLILIQSKLFARRCK